MSAPLLSAVAGVTKPLGSVRGTFPVYLRGSTVDHTTEPFAVNGAFISHPLVEFKSSLGLHVNLTENSEALKLEGHYRVSDRAFSFLQKRKLRYWGHGRVRLTHCFS